MAVASLFKDYFTYIAKNIGSVDVIKNDENLLTCLLKHDNHESIKCRGTAALFPQKSK